MVLCQQVHVLRICSSFLRAYLHTPAPLHPHNLALQLVHFALALCPLFLARILLLALIMGFASAQICTETCYYTLDGACDDGGPGAAYSECSIGTDCTDCGP